MRPYILLRTGMLLITLLIPAFFANTCTAASVNSNNITLEKDGMTREYKEYITDNDAVSFRNFIDVQIGNGNNFVNAWEILKAETFLRNQTRESMKIKPDVKLNGSSEPVKVKDVDFWLSKEALGKAQKNSSITNSASVIYIFEKKLGQDIDIWFMGTPNSSVTITLPAGFDIKKTEGLENKSQEFENNCTVLKGNFSSQENITLWISENESSKARDQRKEENTEQGAENKSRGKENWTEVAEKALGTKKLFGSFKETFARFYPSPKS